MRAIYAVLEIVAVAFAFAAAWFWFRSAHTFVPEVNFDSVSALKMWFDETAWSNHAAAFCAGISAVASGLLILVVRLGF